MKSIVHTSNNKFISQKIQKAKKESVNQAVMLMCECVALTLFDKFGFSKEDVRKAIENLEYMADSITQGYMSREDVIKTLSEEYDCAIVETKHKKE